MNHHWVVPRRGPRNEMKNSGISVPSRAERKAEMNEWSHGDGFGVRIAVSWSMMDT